MRNILLFCWAAFAAVLLPGGVMAQTAPILSIALTPEDDDGDGILETLLVDMSISDAPRDFRLATVANNVVTSADRMTGLRFYDAGGAIPSRAVDEGDDPSNSVRRWRLGRPPIGPMRLEYSVTVDPAREPLALPQYELRTGPAGLSGAGTDFLILPADDAPRKVDVSWHLKGLDEAAAGISSLGVGNVSSAYPLRSVELSATYFMAGKPGLYRSEGFFGAWQGQLGFEGDELMQWAARLQRFYGEFFAYRPDLFGVFGRTNTLNPGSGIGLTDSFAFTFDDAMAQQDLKGLLAHEMLHAWVKSLGDTMDAADGLSSSWFGEGLAVHYQRLLPWRAGLIDDAAFLRDLNDTAARYYTNALIATPNDAIAAGFWRDTRVRVLPYDRGSLYFAGVDADIRAASNGERSLDDIVRRMLAERRAGRPMDQKLWESLLSAELGESGLDGFRRMLSGETVLPPPEAFGDCFSRTQIPLRRFDLGFDPDVLVSDDRLVSGLSDDSEAFRAGLRNGDRILNRFPQDALQADQEAELTLQVEREGQRKTIGYRPRGETVLAYQWVSKPCSATVVH